MKLINNTKWNGLEHDQHKNDAFVNLLQEEGRCASAPDPLAGKANVDIYLKNVR